jgi:hypothetical protein
VLLPVSPLQQRGLLVNQLLQLGQQVRAPQLHLILVRLLAEQPQQRGRLLEQLQPPGLQAKVLQQHLAQVDQLVIQLPPLGLRLGQQLQAGPQVKALLPLLALALAQHVLPPHHGLRAKVLQLHGLQVKVQPRAGPQAKARRVVLQQPIPLAGLQAKVLRILLLLRILRHGRPASQQVTALLPHIQRIITLVEVHHIQQPQLGQLVNRQASQQADRLLHPGQHIGPRVKARLILLQQLILRLGLRRNLHQHRIRQRQPTRPAGIHHSQQQHRVLQPPHILLVGLRRNLQLHLDQPPLRIQQRGRLAIQQLQAGQLQHLGLHRE